MSTPVDWLEIEHPVLQAALGGGLSTSALAGTVSAAGGLGTVGILNPPRRFGEEIRRARELAGGRPVAANLLLPVIRRDHVEACIAARPSVVSLFFGFDRRVVRRLREAGIKVLHQVGTPGEARRAVADGAQGLVVQAREAGGHLLGTSALAEAVAAVREAAPGVPLIAAGGIHDAATAASAIRSGADGVAAGTRFLLSPESNAHPAYKARLIDSTETLETWLFGFGWHGRHRVVPNRATRRWCARDPRGPAWLRGMNRLSQMAAGLTPDGLQARVALGQRPDRPLFTPFAPLLGMPEELIEATALYAGRCVADIDRELGAADAVRDLARGTRDGSLFSPDP